MQEMNEGNVYNVQDVFGSKLNSSALGIKKVNKGIKSQLFDSFKRNKIKNKKEIVQQTFDDIFEANAPPVLNPGKGQEAVGNIFPSFDTATNPTGAEAVIVTNVPGTSTNKASFGMGFEVAPNLTASVQQFVNQYADKTDNSSVSRAYSDKVKEKFNLAPESKVVTWQTMNNAVANHLNQNLKQMLQKYNIYVSDEQSGRAAPRVPTETYHYDQYSRQVYKIKNYNDNGITEELALVGPPGGPGMPPLGPPGGMMPPGMPSKKGKKGMKGMPQQPPMDPLKPQPYQGFTNTPEVEARLRELIVTQFDDPDTAEEEIPQDAKWQTLNTAQGNAYQREVMKLKSTHGMR